MTETMKKTNRISGSSTGCENFQSSHVQAGDVVPTSDNQPVDLTVVIPAYNEEQRLPKMLDETLTFLHQRRKNNSQNHKLYSSGTFTYEVIIVDDGSTDHTSDCGQGKDHVRVITLRKNRGKGGAVREGVLAARGNYIIFADADGASKFSDIVKLEDFIYNNREKTDLVLAIGSRAHMEQDSIACRSFFRTILMKGFHLLVRTCCVRTVRDTQCGFKMFSRKAADLLFKNYRNESWAFDVELLYLAEQTNCTIGEIAIHWQEVEGSKIVPVFSWIRMGWDVVCLATLYMLGIYQIPYEQLSKTD